MRLPGPILALGNRGAVSALAGGNSHHHLLQSRTRGNAASLVAGLLENSKRFRFGKAQLNSFQCFETVRALDPSEKREDEAKNAKWKSSIKVGKWLDTRHMRG